MDSKIYYAIRYNNGTYWHRKTSPTPALFLSAKKAEATVNSDNNYAKSTNYTVVKFMEVE